MRFHVVISVTLTSTSLASQHVPCPNTHADQVSHHFVEITVKPCRVYTPVGLEINFETPKN